MSARVPVSTGRVSAKHGSVLAVLEMAVPPVSWSAPGILNNSCQQGAGENRGCMRQAPPCYVCHREGLVIGIPPASGVLVLPSSARDGSVLVSTSNTILDAVMSPGRR